MTIFFSESNFYAKKCIDMQQLHRRRPPSRASGHARFVKRKICIRLEEEEIVPGSRLREPGMTNGRRASSGAVSSFSDRGNRGGEKFHSSTTIDRKNKPRGKVRGAGRKPNNLRSDFNFL